MQKTLDIWKQHLRKHWSALLNACIKAVYTEFNLNMSSYTIYTLKLKTMNS